MGWTTPTDRTSGYTVTAADWNIVEDNLTFLASSSGATIQTSEATASTTYVDLTTTGPAVTITTGTKALVITSVQASNSAGPTDGAVMSFAVSGATTLAASDNWLAVAFSSAASSVAAVNLVTGLTAGSNTFTGKYRAAGGGTATFSRRSIAVIPLP